MRIRRNWTSSELDELWRRWRRGDTISSIAMAIDRKPGTIHCYLTTVGGVRPRQRIRSSRSLSLGERSQFKLIEAEKDFGNVSMMCRLLGVSRSGFYASLERPAMSEREKDNLELTEKIRDVHSTSRGTYGSPRVFAALRIQGESVGVNRVARLMREHGITARPKRRFKRTTDSSHNMPVASNVLDRGFDNATGPNQIWVGDITYVWTLEGWLYLAVIIDLFSRRVVGWSMADNMRTDLVMNALMMSIGNRLPKDGVMHHSDRGSQYASFRYQEALRQNGMTCSMSRKGECYDNACAESFFGTLKTELIHRQTWPTHASARSGIHDYIEVFYNRKRLHSSLGYCSPANFEAALESTKVA